MSRGGVRIINKSQKRPVNFDREVWYIGTVVHNHLLFPKPNACGIVFYRFMKLVQVSNNLYKSYNSRIEVYPGVGMEARVVDLRTFNESIIPFRDENGKPIPADQDIINSTYEFCIL